MSRGTTISLILVSLALAGVVVGTIHWIGKSREQLIAQFEREELQRLDQAAREVRGDFDDIRGDLRFVDELLRSTDGPETLRREFGALLAVVKPYRALALYGRDGKTLLWVADPRAVPSQRAEDFTEQMKETAVEAVHRAGEGFQVSGVLSSDPTRDYRVVAMRASSDRFAATVALLVDTGPVLSRLRIATAGNTTRLLVLGRDGSPTAGSDPSTGGYVQLAESRPAIEATLREGRAGTLRLGEDDAEQLGFARADVVVSQVPVFLGIEHRWLAILFSSTSILRSHERAIVVRLAMAATAAIVCLVGFGAFLVRVSRREAVLRERLHQSDRLAHFHEKTEKILDNIPSGVMALSRGGRISALNRVLRTRVPTSSIEGTMAEAFPLAAASLVWRLSSLVEQARASEHVRSIHGERLPLFGEEGVYSIHAIPLEPRDPDVACLLVIDDLSEVASLSTQLLRAEKLKTVGVLGAGIAHEMGTPLGVIRARAEYILGKLGAEQTHAVGLTAIVRQVDQLTRTIRQLLDFSRPRAASARTVQLVSVASSVADLLRFEMERRKLSLLVEVPADLPPAFADADQLQQALVNLVMNASDACREGGTIRIAADRDDDSGLRISVIDDGCGIPEAHRNQVFDPFFTTKKRGQGTGLGLTLVAQIARNHGGSIELSSEVDRGTTVVLHWPGTASPEEQRDASV